ncbi:MAG: efflux RND transporter periplasmic adaptor subunit [Hyphomicrobiaceae bacterium]
MAGQADERGEASAQLRALVVPLRHATISSRLQATILAIGPENGEAFAAGDQLVAFDCRSYEAERLRAVASADAAEAAARVREELARAGSTSRLQALLAEADAARARADVAVAEQVVAECVIAAPFAGRVVKRIANAHETVGFGTPLVEIVADREVEFRALVPSRLVGRVAIGDPLSVRIDETGASYRAKVSAIGAWIDNVSGIVELRASLAGDGTGLLPGMSGTASITMARERRDDADGAP